MALCSSTVTLLLPKHGGITQEKWLLLPTQIITIIVSRKWNSSLMVSHSNIKCIHCAIWTCPLSEGCPKPAAMQSLVTPNMSLLSGYQIKIENLLTMRANVCHYCAILDMYAPCIVSYQTRNDDLNMNHYCCTTDPKLFNANVLLVSDEAFLLLFLINGGVRWMSEIKQEIGKFVFVLTDAKAILLFPHTFIQCNKITELGRKTRNSKCP